jgi:hypothetical protein
MRDPAGEATYGIRGVVRPVPVGSATQGGVAVGRIQLSRRAGWRKPAGVVVVARPSKWGNPFRVGDERTAAEAVELFERALNGTEPVLPFTADDVRRELAGRDLACWCRPDQPCHADVLLRIANAGADQR